MIYFKSSFLTVLSQIFIYVPYLIFGVLLAACVFAFAFKPNMEFLVRTKTGEAVIPIRCEKTGFAALGNVIDAQYMGYNEVLPTDETEKAIREIGAIINDIQNLVIMALPNGNGVTFVCLCKKDYYLIKGLFARRDPFLTGDFYGQV